ncbi:MAG TPA: type II toxin-antitoxin system VapC family toxin [Acidobacteriota bacterium]|nr:type II toxin-antitoxin system VapC family toxin [Acidobacteriota bacterium]
MIAVDTNILVRIFVDDPSHQQQVEKVRKHVHGIKRLYVPQIVQVEMVWVLQRAFGLPKPDLLHILDHLRMIRTFVLQRPEAFRAALERFRKENADFADCLILQEALDQEAELLTLDQRLSSLDGVSLLR